ncbi:hypothetical protein I8748_25105 [Nostoc sp. CENA67]|uniref:Uncharacterized protein n=1 Tax=Amazonocrinis nigriterrae CENA67 TaxID=2794033 RepID=A0A8J7HXD8_9NOST|nr:hypothetical protein [Amazonocrinis nigriterrae]MBH8565413.1 hypothetical protein [Amazonocrinis nigriterrae CENA67]
MDSCPNAPKISGGALLRQHNAPYWRDTAKIVHKFPLISLCSLRLCGSLMHHFNLATPLQNEIMGDLITCVYTVAPTRRGE